MKSCSAAITRPARITFSSSSHDRMIVPSRSGTRGKIGGKGNASGVQNCCSE
jgi:hypothetical protein